jgi:hypothetical protein
MAAITTISYSNNLLEERSRHSPQKSRHSHKNIQLGSRHYVKWDLLEPIVSKKYYDYGEGITYPDILKRFPEHVHTAKQAQKILRNWKDRGVLHTCARTKPQQYFLDKGSADLAAARSCKDYNKLRHSNPIGGTHSKTPQKPDINLHNDKYANDEEQELIAYNITQAIELAASNDNRIPTGLHNILIHVDLNPGTEKEAYYNRLADVPPSNMYNKAKCLETIIDGYYVKYFIYPNGKVEIRIPSSQKPFVILGIVGDYIPTLDFPDYFLAFVAQIRDFLQRRLSDNVRCKIVPPLLGSEGSKWILKYADIGWDVPTTVQNYGLFCNGPLQIQLVTRGVFLKIYRNLLLQQQHNQEKKKTKPYLRIEEAAHTFDTPIVDAAEILRELLSI